MSSMRWRWRRSWLNHPEERPGRRQAGPVHPYQPSSLSRYCGIWFAAASADTAAWVFTSADDSVACSAATSTSLIAELADSRFWVWVEIESAEKLNRDSWAPMSARAAETVLMAVSSAVSAVFAPVWVETSSVETPSEVEVRLDSVMVMVSLACEPTSTETPDANTLVPSSRLWLE